MKKIEPSTFYYCWGITTGTFAAVLTSSGLSIWIWILPLSVLGVLGLEILKIWMEPNRHYEDKK